MSQVCYSIDVSSSMTVAHSSRPAESHDAYQYNGISPFLAFLDFCSFDAEQMQVIPSYSTVVYLPSPQNGYTGLQCYLFLSVVEDIKAYSIKVQL